MALRIGDVAPDCEADTTEGHLRFHEWLGDSWGVLVSHPKDFTPVCTTELGYMAKMKPEFDKRNAKIIGISVDAVDTHKRWSNDIKETQGYAPNYPMIGDPTLAISKLCRMLRRKRQLKDARPPTTRRSATCSWSGRTRRSARSSIR
jgi:alkyl hydroperoxide reductase subunit AhpC